jgi:hypothetical protein
VLSSKDRGLFPIVQGSDAEVLSELSSAMGDGLDVKSAVKAIPIRQRTRIAEGMFAFTFWELLNLCMSRFRTLV